MPEALSSSKSQKLNELCGVDLKNQHTWLSWRIGMPIVLACIQILDNWIFCSLSFGRVMSGVHSCYLTFCFCGYLAAQTCNLHAILMPVGSRAMRSPCFGPATLCRLDAGGWFNVASRRTQSKKTRGLSTSRTASAVMSTGGDRSQSILHMPKC